MTDSDEFDRPSVDDTRVDNLARAAGADLRRPAPADGFSRVRRARRNQQITRVAGATAAIAAVAIGVVAWRINSPTDPGIVTVEPTVVAATTLPTVITGAPEPTSTTETASPSTTTIVPEATDASSPPPTTSSVWFPTDRTPGRLYSATDEPGFQQVIDALTGAVLRTEPVDDVIAASYQPQYVAPRVDNAAGTYRFQLIGPANEVDYRCGSPLYIGPLREGVGEVVGRSAPSNAGAAMLSPDGRQLIVASTDCSTTTTDSTSPGTVPDRVFVIQRFPADDPTALGETLGSISGQVSGSSFDASGRFVFVGANLAGELFHSDAVVFDLTTGGEVDVFSGCEPSPSPSLRTSAGSMGSSNPPGFFAGSTIAYTAVCPDGSQHAVIVDLADPIKRVDVVIPGAGENDLTTIELDRSATTEPTSAWFVVRVTDPSEENRRAFVGQALHPLRSLDGISDPTFQPLWSPGG